MIQLWLCSISNDQPNPVGKEVASIPAEQRRGYIPIGSTAASLRQMHSAATPATHLKLADCTLSIHLSGETP